MNILSGIPLGLAGFKLKDREDRKSKSSHNSLHHHHHLYRRHQQNDSLSAEATRTPIKPPNRSSTTLSLSNSPAPTSGWSYILEDWYCRGVGNLKGAKPILSREPNAKGKEKEKEKEDIAPPKEGGQPIENGHHHVQSNSQPMDLTWDAGGSPTIPASQSDAKSDEDAAVALGPYQLLSKERLMGIYLAVFVHRDAAHFVEGM